MRIAGNERARVSRLVGVMVLAACAAASQAVAEPDAMPPGSTLRTGKAAFGDWRQDAPGVRRLIRPGDLPAPYASRATAHSPRVVAPPAGFAPKVPPGFTVSRFAADLDAPRALRVAPNGDVFVAETSAGRIRVLRPGAEGGPAKSAETFAARLDGPFGIAFYPPGPEPQWVYVAAEDRVVRYPYRNGDLKARGPAEVIVPKLPSGGHVTRDIVFSKDGSRMLVSVGSQSNVAEQIAPKSVAEAQAFDAAKGATGALWGGETSRAAVLAFTPDGKNERIYATGIRNCVGLAVNAASGDVWCSTNERDGLGDDLVPDYLTRVREGGYYGWPWYYIGNNEEPRLKGQRPDLAGKAIVPDVLLQPHSASLQMTFYDAKQFPAEYAGNAFAAEHGSWNRSEPTGYKVIRAIVKNGVPTGEYEDFMTGFALGRDRVAGRPVGVAVAADGALLVSDDGNGIVWRVGYPGWP